MGHTVNAGDNLQTIDSHFTIICLRLGEKCFFKPTVQNYSSVIARSSQRPLKGNSTYT